MSDTTGNKLHDGEPYIVTYSGQRVHPFNPRPDSIKIEDIAHALANQCRFTGHVRSFYSVAQHSILVASCVPPDLKLQALMHDASEAYLSDIARPVKMQADFNAVYADVEARLMRSIATVFGFAWPIHRDVKAADNLLLMTEARDLLSHDDWWKEGPFLPTKIGPWSPTHAEDIFLATYQYVTEGSLVPV